MKVYILLVLVLAALAIGCVGKKPSESATLPETPIPLDSELENDLAQIDSLLNDSSMDISLSEVNADAFT